MDKSKIAVEVFDACARVYQEKFMDMDLYHDTFDLVIGFLENKNASILDIACGPGNISRYFLNKNPHYDILGIDLSDNMLKLAKTNSPSARFQKMDARDLSKIPQKFDAVICGFCLPYLSKEEALQLIKDASAILNPNGILYISTMENDYEKSAWKGSSTGEFKEIFTHYHQYDYLSKGLLENHFEIMHVSRKDYPQADGTFTQDLILIAKYIYISERIIAEY